MPVSMASPHAERAAQVVGVDVGHEAVRGVVGRGHDLLLGGEGRERGDRSEDLLARHARIRGDAGAAPWARRSTRPRRAPRRRSTPWRRGRPRRPRGRRPSAAPLRRSAGRPSTPSCVPRPTVSAAIFAGQAGAELLDDRLRARRCGWPPCTPPPCCASWRPSRPSTASSRSASSKTMNGALPPSSIDVRSTLSAHCASSTLPTFVEPVNDSLRASPERISGSITAPRLCAGHDVHDAVRQARLEQDGAKRQHRQRGLRGRA